VLGDLNDALAIIDRHHQVAACSAAFSAQCGLPVDARGWKIDHLAPALLPTLALALDGRRSVTTLAQPWLPNLHAGIYHLTFTPYRATPDGPVVSVILHSQGHDLPGPRQRRRTLLDTLPDMVYRADADGNMTYVSEAVEQIFGYTVDEALGLHVLSYYVDPDKRHDFIQALQDGHGQVANHDIHLYRKDGSTTWVSVNARLIYDGQGQPAGIEGVIRDIDQRKRDEQDLIESHNLIQALLDASSEAIMLFTGDGTVLSINTVMSQRFGKDPNTLIGSCLWDLFPPEVSEQRNAASQQVIRSGKPVHLTDQRGNQTFRNAIYPVFNASGAVDKVAVFSRDITQEVQDAQEIKRYVAEIEQSNRDLESFAFAASHDLREPLRMIGSFTDLLEARIKDQLDDEGRDYLGFIKSGVSRLGILIHDLLDYARIGQHEVTPQQVDMAALVQRVWADCKVAVEESGATLALDAPLPSVFGYQLLIERLISNLIANALRYRHPDRPPQITIGCQNDGLTWYVRDNGQGIDPQYHQRIFVMFQRLNGGWQDDSGSGLGLAIVQRVVERHGGHLWVESTVGNGATFFFTLNAPRPLAGRNERPTLDRTEYKP
jgi:PAS domain S-box-containing protein